MRTFRKYFPYKPTKSNYKTFEVFGTLPEIIKHYIFFSNIDVTGGTCNLDVRVEMKKKTKCVC